MRKKNLSSRLAYRMMLQHLIRTDDGAGGYTQTWENRAALWADIEPISAREIWAANKITASSTHKITLRAKAEITEDMRLMHGNTVYSIKGILPQGRSGKMEIMAETGEGV